MAMIIGFWAEWMGMVLYIVAALIWLIPDRRIEKQISEFLTEVKNECKR